jgi:hypothetical protein
MKDLRAKQILTPVTKFADRILHSWPIKLKEIPKFISKFFDNSTGLTYTTILLTIDNELNDSTITYKKKRTTLNII